MARPTKTTPESIPDIVPDSQEEDERDLRELRQLLNGVDRRRLRELRREVEAGRIDVARLGRMLPRAILECDRAGQMLQESLHRPITRTLHESIRREPEPMADALFPVMGPAIRRSILATVESMVESLNRTLELALSPRGWRWRVEAWHSGRPFAEVVLLHTLKYQVEQVFLIERNSGTLLRELRDGPPRIAEGDLAASMVSAIEDFCRDSMTEGTEGELNSFRFGERWILVENGRDARLALVVAGNPPRDLGLRAEQCLQRIHSQLAEELGSFAGDTAPFEAADAMLRPCLERPTAPQEKRRKRPIPAILAILAVLVLLGFWGGNRLRDQRRLERLVDRLEADAGWLVTSSEISGARCHLRVLRDPDAPPLGDFLAGSSVPEDAITIDERSFLAVDDQSVLRRARRVLAPPSTVDLSVGRGILNVEGRAAPQWLAHVEATAPRLHGVERVRVLAAPDRQGPADDRFELRRRELERQSITLHGALDDSGLLPIRDFAAELLRYTSVALEIDEDPRVYVLVSAESFPPDAGLALGVIVDALTAAGLPREHLIPTVVSGVAQLEHFGIDPVLRPVPRVHWRAAASTEPPP